MITMVARMRVRSENAAAYEQLMDRVTRMTLAKEPGVRYYGWGRSADEPGVYVVVEVYEDEHAQAAHMETAWVREALPRAMALVEGGFEISQYVTPGQKPVQLRHNRADGADGA
ncbi:MAG: antibiotic biosynthesis monooxygenase [Novosphingobium sp.]|nr:antibiotic biosynthesis monooxygenase [Novosphingobium sp.]